MPEQGTSTGPISVPHVNGNSNLSASTSSLPPTASASNAVTLATQTLASPEVEQTLTRLSSHRNVRGVMVCARQGPIIRHTGVVFEGEQGKRYATIVKRIVDTCTTGLGEVDDSGDEVRFIRMRTKRHEIMITPGNGLSPVLSGSMLMRWFERPKVHVSGIAGSNAMISSAFSRKKRTQAQNYEIQLVLLFYTDLPILSESYRDEQLFKLRGANAP